MKFDFKLLLVDSTITNHAKKVSNNNQLEKVSYYIDNTFGWNYLDKHLNTSSGLKTIPKEIRNYNIGTTNEANTEIRNIYSKYKLKPYEKINDKEPTNGSNFFIKRLFVLSRKTLTINVLNL